MSVAFDAVCFASSFASSSIMSDSMPNFLVIRFGIGMAFLAACSDRRLIRGSRWPRFSPFRFRCRRYQRS